jgi:hypothetical protein
LVNNPPRDEEGQFYSEIARSRIVPQGICVANSAGKVLDWVVTFDDKASIAEFLDHALERFQKYPAGNEPVAAERYMKFPSHRLADTDNSANVLPTIHQHPAGKRCPAQPALPSGTINVRLVGRALDSEGKPLTDTVGQENYIEDQFSIPVSMQERLVRTLHNGETNPVRLPDELARLWVMHGYLGMLDVQPLSNPCGGKAELRRCEFRAEKVHDTDGTWRVKGQSEVFTDEMANAGPGDRHEVKLSWEGFFTVSGNRLSRLLLSAEGTEKLRFGSRRRGNENMAASLPAGRRIDMECAVRYGLLGEVSSGK